MEKNISSKGRTNSPKKQNHPPKSWTGKILPRLLTILQRELTLFTTHFSHRYSTLPDPPTLQTVLP